MKTAPIRCVIALTILNAACGTTPQVDMEAETASLRMAADQYHRMASALNADGVVELYAEDNVTLPPCGARVDGVEGMRAFAEEFTSVPGLSMNFTTVYVEVSSSGDLGYTLANVDVSMEGADGTTLQEVLRDVHVWRKVDGAWKVTLDIWNSPDPLPCPDM